MRWKLPALDLDGTLIEADESILLELCDRLNSLSASGRGIVIASGRPREDIESILVDIGAGVAGSRPIAFVANERDVYLRQGDAYEADAEWNDRLFALESEHLAAIRLRIDAWLETQTHRDGMHRYDDEATENRRAVIALCTNDLERAMSAQREFAAVFRDQALPVQVFRNRSMLVFRHESICKGKALERAARSLNVDSGDVLAIGDSDNDLGMLDGRYGFQSACPANAEAAIQEAVRANGGRVASRPNGFGVLELLADT